ncbi:hypothetical protein AALC25_00275 [Lachnospiraceae bacterium 29-84]
MKKNGEEMAVEINIEDGETGMSAGLAMLIGSGLTLAAIAGIKAARKAWAKRKSNQEESDGENLDEDDLIDSDYDYELVEEDEE